MNVGGTGVGGRSSTQEMLIRFRRPPNGLLLWTEWMVYAPSINAHLRLRRDEFTIAATESDPRAFIRGSG